MHSRIDTLIRDSEQVFLRFARSFPAFVVEMKRSLELSSQSTRILGQNSSMEAQLRALSDAIGASVSQATLGFEELHRHDDLMLTSLSAGIETLSGLDQVIARIKEDSTEMELISLNAMTVALKAGASGKAFSVITDELKRLSTRTISLTDQLTADGRHLLDSFQAYRVELERLEGIQASLFSGLDERLQEAFSRLEQTLGGMGLQLSELSERSSAIREPVGRIMETVQMQDIVRQSLDHVLVALDELQSQSQEHASSTVGFRLRLLELAAQILKDVEKLLDGALDTLERESSRLKSIVTDGELRRKELLAGSFGANATGMSGAFGAIADMLATLDRQVAEYLRSKAAIANNGSRLNSTVELLEKRFLAFSKIVNRFRTIDIASRIEVSKTAILHTMDDTVREMSQLTIRIGLDVNEALGSTKSFMEDTRKAFRSYKENSEQEELLANGAAATLREAVAKMDGVKDSIAQGARGFSLFTEEFVSLLSAAIKEVDTLRVLRDTAREGVRELEGLCAELQDQARDAPVDAHADQASAARLQEIIERFTIYAHKRTAGNIGGFVVEAEAQTGEITFF